MPEIVQQPKEVARFQNRTVRARGKFMSTLGWRKSHCKRGHERTPDNLTTNGDCKICMKLSSVNWRNKNLTHSRELNKKNQRKYNKTEKGKKYSTQYHKTRLALDPRIELLYAAKKRAKEEGLTFDLVIEDIVIPETCPVLGIELFKGTRQNRDHSPSVDRFLPVLGYTKNNIRVISWRANDLKKNATVEELTKVLAYMKGNNA
jgi:hypothetical protein